VQRHLHSRTSGRPVPRRAFTLVELVTAASLMTVMMLGVVQIFGFITQTASDAQGLVFALEQERALLDTIHRDLRGLDRTGYLRIQTTDIKPDGSTGSFSRPLVPRVIPPEGQPVFWQSPIDWYCNDLLAMTTVGSFWEKRTDDRTAAAETATGAEVVYSSDVKTPDARLRVGSGMSAPQVDQRRNLLARGVWVFRGTDNWTGNWQGAGTDMDVRSKADVMARLAGTANMDRVSSVAGVGGFVSPIAVWPITGSGAPQYSWTLRRVATSCTSEFFVEILDVSSDSSVKWARQALTVRPQAAGAATVVDCPRAIRVTVAVHDPNDTKPAVGMSKRYEGYALQEVFWIGDP
jgi:hypothetical protein